MNFNRNKTTHWTAIWGLFLGVTCLIASEFIPVSLLTSIAHDLSISEGTAGQSISIVGIFAVMSSLTIATLIQEIDRKLILLMLSMFLVIANLIVAFAPTYSVMLIGRAILGICVGGFWSLASAVILLLSEEKNIPKAFSIVYAGVSVATIISLPLGSLLGELIGWRNVFLVTAILSLLALIFQFLTLPSLKTTTASSFKSMFALLKERWILIGIIATILSYGGYHIVFTYLKPFLEVNLMLPYIPLTIVLLAFGVSNCLGTFLSGIVLNRYFKSTMIMIHFLLSIVALLLFSSTSIYFILILLLLWGFIFGFIPVGWSMWITRTNPSKAEMMGGISVAAIQFSIGLAAAIGGGIFDRLGMNDVFITAALIAFVAALLLFLSFQLFFQKTGQKI